MEHRVLLSIVNWTGAGDASSWSDPQNWSTNALPTAADDVVIGSTTPGTSVTSTGDVAIDSLTDAKPLTVSDGSFATTNPSTIDNNLTVSGASFGGSSTITINGPNSTWSSGTLTGSVTNAGTLTISSGNSKFLDGTLTNAGTVAVSGGGVIYANADNAAIVNQAGATFDFQADATLYDNGHAGLSFVNAGTLEKSAGTRTSEIDFPVSNTGAVVNVASGTLSLAGGGAFSGTTTLTGALTLTSGTFTLANGSALLGSGSLQDNNATLALAGSVTVIAPLVFSAGMLAGTGTFAAGSQVTWSGGFLVGSITNAGTLTVAGDAPKFLNGTLTNTATVEMSGTGGIYVEANSAAIVNQAGAVIDFQTDAQVTSNGHAGTSFTNAGTLEKSAGTNTLNVFFPFTNSGTISATSGTLEFSAAFVNAPGSSLFANGGSIEMIGPESGPITGVVSVGSGDSISISDGPLTLNDPASLQIEPGGSLAVDGGIMGSTQASGPIRRAGHRTTVRQWLSRIASTTGGNEPGPRRCVGGLHEQLRLWNAGCRGELRPVG